MAIMATNKMMAMLETRAAALPGSPPGLGCSEM